MSLSKQNKGSQPAWGTIYSQGREHSLGGIEHTRSTAWTPEDEASYLERVRERAGQMATKLITEARREAEDIKRAAQEEGYALGLENARAELEEFRSGMGEAVSAVLGAIEGQCSSIFDQWRDDLVALVRLSVEKITALELSENRKAMLEALLTESVLALEKRRQLVIRVNPEDEPMLSDIVGLARERFPDVNAWRVKADSAITPGGMMVESESSLAEGRLESRVAAVEEILSRLVLRDAAMAEAPLPEPAAQAAPHAPAPEDHILDAQPEEPMPEAQASAPPATQEDTSPEDGRATEPLPQVPAAPQNLPGLDLSDPNLSEEEITAALEAAMPLEPAIPES